MNFRLTCFSFVAVFSLSTESSARCEDFILLSEPQIDEGFAILENPNVPLRQKVREYKRLSCSDDPFIREEAVLFALRSEIDAFRNVVMQDEVFERQNLMLQPFDNGALTEEQKSWAREHPVIQLDFTHTDRDRGCISLAYNDCRTGYVLDVRGAGISIDDRRIGAGELVLNSEGVLEGYFAPLRTQLRIPVQARLR